MSINRKVWKVMVGALLVASLPAGAQVLGGGLGGALNGTLTGGIGQGVQGNGGIMGSGAFDAPDTIGTMGQVRDRTRQAGGRTKNAAAKATDGARGSGAAAAQATQADTQQDHNVLLGGATSANAQRHVLGRDVTASGDATSGTAADRTGFNNSTSGHASASAKKTEPAPAQTPPAQ